MSRSAGHNGLFSLRFCDWVACTALFATVLATVPVAAQDASTGAVRGSVADAGGSRVAWASVVLVNSATAQRYTTATDDNGNFAFDLLPPGDYAARAEASLMSPQVSPQLHVDVGGATHLEFKLGVAGTKETVTVSGAPPLVETVPSSVSALIDERAISDLPLNGRRFTDLALLTPGVTQDPRGMTSTSNGDLAFGGIRGFQSSFLVDGADNNNGFFSQARGRYRAPYQFSNEVVQEFRVSSNAYGVELGRSGGAVVNVVTKSGSNHWHGTAFYYLRDRALNATPAYLTFKPKDRQHQFGFTVGGPIQRNQTFFFAGFDQHIFHLPTVVQFLNGSTVLVPLKGQEPLSHGDYEDSDQALVFGAAAQLNTMAGQYQSALLGNAGFLKIDTVLSQHNHLSARLSTSQHHGQNNVFFDPSSPITAYTQSGNGEESVATESAALSLTSGITSRLISHLRAQFSRDLQESSANSGDPRTRITSVLDGFGRSSILPRRTREHRLHLAETFSLEGSRHAWKFGGDALLTWTSNFFPSLFGGEYIFDNIRVNPFTFQPQLAGMKTTPLRAYAHQVPRYYIQNFGSAGSNPDTNEYSAFLQDTVRVTNRLALSLGVRYDLQTFSTKGLVSNPLWPASGKVPFDDNNFAPRVGLAYSLGHVRPLVIRAGYGWFYSRVPQIYTSAVATKNGLAATHLLLKNADFYDHQIFPTYPTPMVSCAMKAAFCAAPPDLASHSSTEISAFSPDFRTPKVHQASLHLEREFADHFALGASYLYVHGQNLIRSRDVNLPKPVNYSYPVYDDSGVNLLGYYDVASFSTWQMSRSLTCPYPPCINPLARPIPQLASINQFDSASSSVYHAMTVSLHRRMTNGLYFRLAYTWAHAIDDVQDALVAGRPAVVQNSYSTSSERGSSVTDQRHRLVFSWIGEPQPFNGQHPLLAKAFNDWKLAGVVTMGSGRPVTAQIIGDANGDDNSSNDRLPGVGRNSSVGPDYFTADVRTTRKLYIGKRLKLDLMVEVFNLFNHTNQRLLTTDDFFGGLAAQFIPYSTKAGSKVYPAYYQKSKGYLKPSSAYAPRQLQLALKLMF